MTPRLGPAGIARQLALPGTGDGTDRARILLVRRGRLALIERVRAGERYWVVPGGGVEAGETLAVAARREAAEELGLPVTLGPLRIVAHVPAADGWQRQWCFEASADSDEIAVTAGPELHRSPADGTHRAVWLGLDDLAGRPVWPEPAVRALLAHQGGWPAAVIEDP